jgi:integrase
VIVADPILTPSFPALLQRFFVEHLAQHRAVSPRTIAAYRDTFRLLLDFVEGHIGKSPTTITLVDLDAKLILSFLDHLEKYRNNGARSRNARLAALRSFLKYAVHHDLAAIEVIERALAIPMKKFDRPMLGFLSRQEMQAVVDAPDPERAGSGSGTGHSSACCTTPALGCRKRSVCGSETSPMVRRPTSWERAAKSAAFRSGDLPPRWSATGRGDWVT